MVEREKDKRERGGYVEKRERKGEEREVGRDRKGRDRGR